MCINDGYTYNARLLAYLAYLSNNFHLSRFVPAEAHTRRCDLAQAALFIFIFRLSDRYRAFAMRMTVRDRLRGKVA